MAGVRWSARAVLACVVSGVIVAQSLPAHAAESTPLPDGIPSRCVEGDAPNVVTSPSPAPTHVSPSASDVDLTALPSATAVDTPTATDGVLSATDAVTADATPGDPPASLEARAGMLADDPVMTSEAPTMSSDAAVDGVVRDEPTNPTPSTSSSSSASASSSASSDESSPVALDPVCAGVVDGLSAVPRNNEVQLTWTPDRAGAQADWYGVVVSTPGATDRVVRVAGPLTGSTVTGLRNGVEYAFTVYAVTAAGSSAASETVRATPVTGMEGEVAGLIVGFEPGVSVQDGQEAVPGESQVTAVDLTIAGKVSQDASLVELSQPLPLDQAEQVAKQLEADPAVAWAEPDRFLFTADAASGPDLAQAVSVPDDADYATTQWNLWDAYGVGVGDGATAMTKAWAGGTGEGATVAVIDTGITAHPDLDSQVVSGYDFVSDPSDLAAARSERGPPEAFDADATDPSTFGAAGWDANPTDPGDWRGVAPVRDSTWHGTKVAGVIAAQARNGEGIAGIAPGAKIEPIRALSWRGGLLSDIAASITWASGGTVDSAPANEHPADVINLSLSAQTTCPVALQDAIDGARERGTVVVAAAGNANDDAAKYTPGNCNGVITVAATDRSGMRAPYSNYGSRVDIAAPGGNTPVDGGITTTANAGTTTAGDPTWAADQGTSLAAAHVSAAAAILKAKDQQLTPDQIEQQLTGSIRPFATTTCDANPDATCGTGILSLAQISSVASGDQDYAMSPSGTTVANSMYGQSTSNTFLSSMQGAFTIEAWVKPASCSNPENTVLVKEYSFGLACQSTYWRYYLGNGSNTWAGYRDQNTAIVPLIGQWQHVAVTRSGQDQSIEFYFNGRLAHTAAAWNSAIGNDTTYPLYVGARASSTGFLSQFVGGIDEVRFYNTYRGSSIATDMHTYGPTDTSGLLAYYDFNEGPAGTSGNGTVPNRASTAASGSSLRLVNGPVYTDVKQVTTSGLNTVVTFPRSYLTAAGGWRVPTGGANPKVVIVGGGGGGAGRHGGGGGAGGLVNRYTSGSVTAAEGAAYPIVVGQGGLGSVGSDNSSASYDSSTNGQSSTAFGLTADGGGKGTVVAAPGAGGSGGGTYSNPGPGGAPTGNGLGSAGGIGLTNTSNFWSAGGGGGAGGVGGNSTSSSGGAGGAGLALAITGSSVTYAAGGAGGFNGASMSGAGANGAANTGTGGGGAGSNTASVAGGAGGSGVVIVSYDSGCTPNESSYIQGGTEYRVLRWATPGSTCTWTPPTGVTTFSYLVVGGGGGGGGLGPRAGFSGGGGGGGAAQSGSTTHSGASGIQIVVGSGGLGGPAGPATSDPGPATAGGSSQLVTSAGTVTAAGGGRGGSGPLDTTTSGGVYTETRYAPNGTVTGGGGAAQASKQLGATATYKGGDGYADSTGSGQAAGGGGGAAAAGSGALVNAGGAGGAGVSSSITGASAYYGGGGGGGKRTSAGSAGAGGSGGGGAGGRNANGSAGTDGLGGGGGGGAGDSLQVGGDGGSGTVILRYAVVSGSSCVRRDYTNGTYTVVEFQGSGSCSWTAPTGVAAVDALLVGGGGGGGGRIGGGGGAGEVRTISTQSVTPSSTYSVVVGAGGAGGTGTSSSGATGTDGGSTSVFGVSVAGGGGGGYVGGGGAGGRNGGSGGGGGCSTATYAAPGSSVTTGSGSGSSGGSGSLGSSAACVAGGGGGAGGAGDPYSGQAGGSGGVGIASSITGTSVFYGGGGGGGVNAGSDALSSGVAGTGGLGGGGAGGGKSSSASGFDGTDGLGSGGGGGSNMIGSVASPTSFAQGGAGGDGTLILRYSRMPNAPTSVSATAGQSQATVAWTAPEHTGGLTITNYTVTSSPGSKTCTTSGVTCDVTGLTPGTAYTFSVTATNDTGTSSASSASSAVTPFDVVTQFSVTQTGGATALAASQTAGSAFNVRVRALDSSGRLNTAYTGTVSLTSAAFTGTVSATIASGGLVDSVSITPTVAGSGHVIAASGSVSGSTVSTSSASGAFTTSPGSASLSQSTIAAGTSSIAANGTSTSTITVQLKDAYDNSLTASGGTVALSTTRGTLSSVTNNSNGSYTATLTSSTSAGTATVSGTLGGSALTSTAAVTFTAGTASKLVITGSATQVAGATQNLTITATDAYGNTATAYTGDKSLTFSGANAAPSGTTPSVKDKTGTSVLFGSATTITFTSGVAAVSATANGVLALYKAEAATVSVTDGTISSSGAGTLSVTVSAATFTAFRVTMSGGSTDLSAAAKTAGSAFNARVASVDSYGNTQSSFTGAVTLTSTAWSGNVTATIASNGYVDAVAVTPTVAGATQYVVATSDSTSTSQASSAFTVNAGAATQVLVNRQPVGAQSGALLSTQPRAVIADAYGNTVTTSTAPITASVQGRTGWTSLNGPSNVARRIINGGGLWVVGGGGSSTVHTSANGASWTDRSANYRGGLNGLAYGNGQWLAFGYGLLSRSLDGVTWTDVNGPWSTQAGLWDAAYGAGRWVVIGYNGGGITSTDGFTWTTVQFPSPTTNNSWQEIRFANNMFMAIDGAGKVVTSSDGLTWATSANVSINAFDLAYGNGRWVVAGYGKMAMSTDGISWTTTTLTDVWLGVDFGGGEFRAVSGSTAKVASSVDGITWTTSALPGIQWYDIAYAQGRWIAISIYAPYGVTSLQGMTGTSSQFASAGVVDWSDLTYAGASATDTYLAFSSPGLTSATSSAFQVTPGSAYAANGVVTRASATINVGGSGTTITVQLKDDQGNSLTTGGATVAIATTLGSVGSVTDNNDGTYSATLSPGTTAGTARVSATVGGTAITSTTSVAIAAGSATQLTVTTAADGAAAGVAFTTQPRIQISDVGGNRVTTDSSTVVTATVSAGGTIIGTATATASNGYATFNGLGIGGTAGTAYTLTFSATSLTSVTQSITPTFGTAAKLGMSTQPIAGASGSSLTTQPAVRVLDAYDNVVTSSTATIDVTASGGTLGGTTSRAASSGTATYTNLTFAGSTASAYTLTFASTGLTSVTSSTITPTTGGTATKFILTGSSTQTAGATQSLTITAKDAYDNVAPGYTGSKSLTFSGPASSPGGTAPSVTNATGTAVNVGTATPITFTTGVARVSGSNNGLLRLTKAEVATVSVTDGSISTSGSDRLTVTVSPAALSSFAMTPSTTTPDAGASVTISAQQRDTYGNSISTAGVTVSWSKDAASGTLTSSSTTDASGIATATLATSTASGVSTVVTAASGSASTSTSSIVTRAGPVNAAASTLTPTASSITANGTATATLTLTARDQYGNATTNIGSSVFTISKSSGTGTLGTRSGSAGVYTIPVTAPTTVGQGVFAATVDGATVNNGGASQTLATVDYVVGTATKYLVTASSSTPEAGSAVTVTAQLSDAYGNAVATAGRTVTWSATAATGQAFSAATSTTDASGLATVTFTASTVSGTSRTITATDTLSKTGTSSAVVTQAGSASQLIVGAIGQQTAGTSFSATVTLADAYGNAVNNAGATGTVTLTRASGSGTISGTLTGTIAIGASAVTIAGITANTAESGVALRATGTGAGSTVDGKTGTSTTFTVVPGAAAAYAVTTSSTTPTAGTTVTVTAQLVDANGNAVATSGRIITWSKTLTGGSFATSTSTTNASGIATVVYTAPTTSGITGTITATDASSLTGTSAALTSQVGSASAATSTITPSAASITANGSSVSNITVRLKDVHGNSLTSGGATVIIASTLGTVGGVFDNGDGTYTASLTSTSTLGTATVSATLNGTALSATTNVTFAAGAAHDMTVVSGGGQSATVGTQVASAPTVKVVDVHDNPVAGTTVAFSVTAGGGSLASASATTDVSGIATLPAWTLGTSAGANVVQASVTGGIVANISATATPGTVSKFAVTVTGGTTPLSSQTMTAGVATSVRVTAQDQYGNTNPTWTGTVSLTSTASVGTVTATISANGYVDGVPGTPTIAGTGKVVSASATGIASAAASSTFDVDPGALDAFAVTMNDCATALSAATKTAGTPFTVCVTALDAYSNTKTDWTGTVALTSSAWSGTVDATIATGGSVTQSVTPTVAGTGFTVRAASGATVTTSSSSTFTVNPAAAHALRIVTAPVSTVSGALLSAQPAVEIIDSHGNRTTSTANVTVSESAGTLGGTKTVAAVNGLATFSGLTFDGTVGTTYTLTFGSGALATATASISPSTAGDAGGLRFSVQPSASTTAGTSFGATVRIVDGANNTVLSGADASRMITVTASSGTLGCADGTSDCLTVQASNGVAAFTGLRMTSSESGRHLTASTTLTAGSASVASDPFDIAAAAADSLDLAASATGDLGSGASRTFTATVQDAYGNTVDSSASVMFAATGSGSLAGLGAVTAVHGVAAVTVAGAGVGTISVTANAAGLSLTSSARTFSVTPGAVASVTLDLSSADLSAAGMRTTTATLHDAYGNAVTTATDSITVSQTSGSGSVTGTLTQAATAGVASFVITGDTAGTVSMRASVTISGTTINSGTHTFNVIPGAVSQIVLSGNTADLTAADHRTLTATLKDSRSNVVTGSAATVTFAKTAGSGTVTGLGAAAPVNGIASITIDGEHIGAVQIVASVSGPVTSNAVSFTVVPGSVAGVALSGSSADLASGSTRVFTATLQDVHGNTVTSATDNVIFEIYNGGGSLDVSGAALPQTVAAVNGVATITVTGRTAGLVELDAEVSVGGTLVDSNDRDFTVVPGPADHVSLTGSTANLTAGSTRVLTATVRDANENVVTSSTADITFTKSAGAGGVSGLGAIAASSGSATRTVTGTTAGSVSLVASASGITTSSAVTFTVDPGAAAALSITTEPAGSVHATALTTQPVVRIVDAHSNAVAASGETVTASITAGSGSLSHATATTNGSGVATFSGLTVSGTAGNFELTFAASGLSSATSSSFAMAKAAQTITFAALADMTYGQVPFTVAATSDAGLTVGFTASPSSVCTASGTAGSVIAITGAGTCTVTAAQPGDGSFSAATSVARTFAVAKANQATVSIDSASTVVYGATLALRASGGAGTGALSYAVSGSSTCTVAHSGSSWTLTPGAAGSVCELTATRAGDGNYNPKASSTQTLTVTKAAQVISFSSNVPMSPVSNDTYTPAATATASGTGTSSGLPVVFTIAPASSGICSIDGNGVVTFSAAGSCGILANQAGDANHTAASQVRQTIMVGSINQTIAFPQPADAEYGSSSVSMTATASSGLDVTYGIGPGTTNGACSVSTLGTVSIQDIGTCEVVASQAGDAQYAAASDVVRVFQVVPAVPTAVHITSVSAADQSITAAFTAPGFTGGVALTAYQLAATPVGGGTAVTTSACSPSAVPLACTITGLVNGTEYELAVAAINAAGVGPAVTATTTMTPATAAFAVSGLIAQPDDTTLAVHWTPLTTPQLGGGTFVQYEVSYRQAASSDAFTVCTVAGCTGAALTSRTTASTTITGLDNGTSYEVKIVALTTANGAALDGNTATVTEYPSTHPSAPLDPTVLALTATEIQFSWSSPLTDGGSALSATPYTVTVTSPTGDPVTCTPSNLERHCHATGLTNGAVYTFSVVANNRMGSSPAATSAYTVPSSDATLSDLTLSAGTLSPGFTRLGTAYTASVGNETSSVVVTATTAMPGSTMTINGVTATSGVDSTPLPLTVGETVISIVVTASDPRHTSTYSVTVTRAAPASIPAPPSTDPERRARPAITAITELPALPSRTQASLVLVDGEPVAVQVKPSAAQSTLGIDGEDFSMSLRLTSSTGAPTGAAVGQELVATVGSIVNVDASGYAAGTTVGVYLVPRSEITVRTGPHPRASSGVIQLGEATATDAGEISRAFIIPSDINAGDYVLQINGITETSGVRSVSVGLTLTELVKKPAAPRKALGIGACSFTGSSIALSPACRTELRAMVQQIPSTAMKVHLRLTGVAYGQGTTSSNVTLAKQRAAAVRTYLNGELRLIGITSTVGATVATVIHQGLVPGLTMSPVPVVSSSDGSPATTAVVDYLVPTTT